jgi:hypothetical protein
MSDQENASGNMDAKKGTSQWEDVEHKKSIEDWWEDRSLPQKILVGIGFGVMGIGLIFLFGFVVMILWNWLMPEIFGLKTLTYWQAWGLLALSCILFGRIGGGGSNGKSDRKRKRKLRSYMREDRPVEGEETGGSANA